MNEDQTMGGGILTASVIGIAVYALLLYSYAIVVLQVVAFIAVAGVLVITAWIGWTMATTPPPAPIEIPETQPTSNPPEPINRGTSSRKRVTSAPPSR